MSLCTFLKILRINGVKGISAIAMVATSVHAVDFSNKTFHAAGWMQYASIVKSSDTTQGKRLDWKPLISSGAQFSFAINPSEKLRIEAGIGAVAGHSLSANYGEGGYAPVDVSPYVSNANFNYRVLDEGETKFSVRAGLFAYDYNPDAQNLGLYLLRGPVYPGYVLSGFETKYVLPVANTLGFQFHHQTGGFENDMLFAFETEYYPYWDISPAYVTSYTFGRFFRIGAGVNFYHMIPIDNKITSDTNNIYIDTLPVVDDTTRISFKGTKVMANASIDLKALFGHLELLGPEDLKIYGEVAILGLNNGLPYRALYGNYSNRMPIMVGINLPTFKVLDRLSFEFERYTAKFKDDLSGYNHYGAPTPFPIGKLDTNYSEDNFKWSLYGSKVFQKHVKISIQAASDHFRPGIFKGYGDNNPPAMEAVLFKPSEWYWSSKVAYFF